MMLGRDKLKIQEAEKVLKTQYPKLKTKIILADLGQSMNVDFYESICEQISGLDISILVNNAAWTDLYTFECIALQDNLSRAMLNMGAPALL